MNTHPLLFPFTLCSLKVMSLRPSSASETRSHPRISSSVIHQLRSESMIAVVALASTGPRPWLPDVEGFRVWLESPCFCCCSCSCSCAPL